MARIDPLRNFRYRLEIDSITQAGFSEVDDRRDDDRRRRLPRGHRSAARAQAERPHQVRQHHAEVGPDRRRHGARPLQVARGRLGRARSRTSARRSSSSSRTRPAPTPRASSISDAWPVKYDPSDLNAKGNEVLIELLELANEGIERVA